MCHLRFRSSEASSNRPYLEVKYKIEYTANYYLKDHLGNIRVTVDENGDVVSHDDYYPFGLQMAGRSFNAGTDNDIYKYNGKELDDEAGINWHYYGARYYDAVIGRWMAVDPLAYKYYSVSPYVYTLNNPTKYIDPNGMEVRGDSTDLAQVAESLNNENEGANVTVEKKPEKKVDVWGTIKNFFSGSIEVAYTTNTYFALSTNGSSFNWGANKFTSAMYDVINSRDIIYDVKISEKYNGPDNAIKGTDIASQLGGGYFDERSGGGTVWLSGVGTHSESIGVRFMHEAIGHGHPVTGIGWEGNATLVNQHYNGRYDSGHYGYHPVVGWRYINLYRMEQVGRKVLK